MFEHMRELNFDRVLNYSKTPSRGVKDIRIRVDGSLVYMGVLPAFDPNKTASENGTSIIFSNDAGLVRVERHRISYCGGIDQDVLCIDERQVIVRSKAMYDRPSPFAEGIHTDISLRPQTMMSGKM